MLPQKINSHQPSLFLISLMEQVDSKHPLMKLSEAINWSSLEKEFCGLYSSGVGHPPKPIRLMVGLLMLRHMYAVSDEQVVQA